MSEIQDYTYRFCPACAHPLQWIEEQEDGGLVGRLRCTECGWTHWNNPTPVLAAVVELNGKVLLARNAMWKDRFFGLITGFMEAEETPEDGIRREVLEETSLRTVSLELIGVYGFQRKNQVIIAYHAVAEGQIKLSPELVEYKLIAPEKLHCWTSGTGQALQKWLRSRGYEPEVFERRPLEVAPVAMPGKVPSTT